MKLLVSLAFVLSLFPIFSFADDIRCMDTGTFTTLEDFVDCLDRHTVPEAFYTLSTYTTAQPSGTGEINAWRDAVNDILTNGCLTGPAKRNVTGLNDDFVIARVTEARPEGGTPYTWCILVEAHTYATGNPVYKRGWGFVVTPADPVGGVVRHIHFSAPHPKTDGNTPRQAAALFKRTGAKSLVITGRHRRAYMTSTLCSVAPSPDTYYKTDSSHDNNEPFYLALTKVAEWQEATDHCPWTTCAYIQMHGKSNDPIDPTCPLYDIFMSSGLGNSATSETCYANPLLPITRLKNALITTFPEFDTGTPTDGGSCDLTATRNIFGRFVSGIDPSDVCVNAGTVRRVIPCACTASRGCMGKFIHVEQDPDPRLLYDRWATAITSVFPPSLRATEKLGANIFKIQS